MRIEMEDEMSVKDYFSEFLSELVEEERQNDDEATLEIISGGMIISKASLCQYMKKKREPKISSLMAIAEFFDVSPNDLLGYKKGAERDLRAIEASAYTGLSQRAIKILREKKDDPYFMPVLNFLIEEQEDGVGVLDDIIDYTISDLWDDLAEDDRYNTLPGSARAYATERGVSTAEVNRKESLLNLTDKLPKVRDAFHTNIISCNSKTKLQYVKELAMQNLHFSTIVKILYPQYLLDYLEEANLLNPGHVTLTDELIDTFEKQIRADIAKNHPEIENVQSATPVSFCDLAEYDEFTAVANDYVPTQEDLSRHRQQALSYLKEYREYLK